MPKRSFASIRENSDLRNSKVYGDASQGRRMEQFKDPVNFSNHTKGVVGYTGHNEARNVPLQVHLVHHEKRILNPPPGYAGFIPGSQSESIFGKSKGSIIAAYGNRSRKRF